MQLAATHLHRVGLRGRREHAGHRVQLRAHLSHRRRQRLRAHAAAAARLTAGAAGGQSADERR